MKIIPFSISSKNNFSIQPGRIGKSFCASNLAPLPCDTVTFSGKGRREIQDAKTPGNTPLKTSQKTKLDQSERGSHKVANALYAESEYAFGQLKYTLSYLFDTHVIDLASPDAKGQIYNSIDRNKNKPILYITARRKTPNSIAEKMGSSHIKSKVGAKEQMDDLIGARIVLSGNSTEEGDYVLDKLIEAVKKNRIKVKEVEKHGQGKRSLEYATNSKLNKLVEAARAHGEPLCKYKDEPRDSGYLAIHIATDEIADGYNAEIQILGIDVEEFKEIEDLAYKCSSNKKIPKKYETIKRMFLPVQNNKKLAKDYMEYTRRAYAYERNRPPHKSGEQKNFLVIPKDLNIPKELDFNHIAYIKKMCDRREASSK